MWQLLRSVFKATPIIVVTSLLISKQALSEAAPTANAEEKYNNLTFIPEEEFSSNSDFESDLEKSVMAQTLPSSNNETTPDSTGVLEQVQNYNNLNSKKRKLSDEPMAQITSVSQLRDVSPTDWAYEALRSLVERYGCIIGYPDSTFRGNRALSRYEFAAGLNACSQQIERLIAQSEAVIKEDIQKLQRLMKEFEAELVALGGKLDNLEGRVAFVEDNSFSTTTKFTGQIFTYLSGAFRGKNIKAEGESVFGVFQPSRDENNRPRTRIVDDDPSITMSYYAFLRLNTSFTGKDSLILQFAAGNGRAPANEFLSAGYFNSSGTPFALQTGTPNKNSLVVHELYYDFPVTDNLKLVVGPRIQVYNYFDQNRFTYFINGADSFNSSGSTQFSAIDRGSGAILVWKINDTFTFSAGYVGNNTEFLPAERGSSASDPRRGLFGGTYNIMAELDIAPTDNLNLRFLYTRNRLEAVRSGPNKGLVGGAIGEPIPYGFADDGFGGELRHAFGDVFLFNFDWLVTDGFGVFGRYSYGSTDLTPKNPDREKGSIDSQSLQLGFALPDLGKEGAQATFSYLIPFSIIDGREFLVSGGGDGGVQYEFEANYYYPLTNNISLSPSFYLILRPNNFNSNGPIYVTNLRLQYDF